MINYRWLTKVKKAGILFDYEYEISCVRVVETVLEILPTRKIMENCRFFGKIVWSYHLFGITFDCK